jgi:hypothetical protein
MKQDPQQLSVPKKQEQEQCEKWLEKVINSPLSLFLLQEIKGISGEEQVKRIKNSIKCRPCGESGGRSGKGLGHILLSDLVSLSLIKT